MFSVKYWPSLLGIAFLRAVGLLPLPLIALVGYLLGLMFFVLFIPRRRIAMLNISRCFPEFSKWKVAIICLQNFAYTGQTLLCAGQNLTMGEKRMRRMVTIKNRESYDNALAEKRNIILLAPHFLGLDMGGYILSVERPMITMYQYTKNKLIDRMVKNGRERFDGIAVERKEPLRNLIKLIRQGKPFYYLPDQDAGRKGVFVPFFGIAASTFPMLGKFTQMTNAVVVPCRVSVKPWGMGYELSLGEAIDNFASGDDIKDTTRMNQIIEQMIEQKPEQYFWVHKRFKTRPDKESKFYN